MEVKAWLEMVGINKPNYQFPVDETPHFGLCDYPAQFGIKCPNYVGAVKFYQVHDPNFLVWRRMTSGKTGYVGFYIGNKELSAESFPLYLHDGTWENEEQTIPKLDQLWCFETQTSSEDFIRFPSKLMYFKLGVPQTIRG